jgi:hypothetical protein
VESNWVQSVLRPPIGLLCPTPGDYDDGKIGEMIGKGNRNTRRKPAPVPLCPPQTPRAARTWTRAAAVGIQGLTAWATARLLTLSDTIKSYPFSSRPNFSFQCVTEILHRLAVSCNKYVSTLLRWNVIRLFGFLKTADRGYASQSWQPAMLETDVCVTARVSVSTAKWVMWIFVFLGV